MFFKECGLDVAKGRVVSRAEILENKQIMDYPYIIKHIDSGTSIDCILITDAQSKVFTEENCPYVKEALVEEFIKGKEYTVTVWNGKALGIIEFKSNAQFQDLIMKT